MGRGPNSSRSELQPRSVSLGVRRKFVERVCRKILGHHQNQRLLRNKDDRSEIVGRTVEWPFVEGLVVGLGADRSEQDLVPVGSRERDPLGAVMPPAPPTFSTTTCCFKISPRRGAMPLPTTSVGPPAANGTIIVTGQVGQLSALAVPEASNRATPAVASNPANSSAAVTFVSTEPLLLRYALRSRRAAVHVAKFYFVGIGTGALRQGITQLLTTRYRGIGCQVLWRDHVPFMVNCVWLRAARNGD